MKQRRVARQWVDRLGFVQVFDGRWYPIPWRGYRLACCDCGLTHWIRFRLTMPGRGLEFQVFRDDRTTSAQRRQLRIRLHRRAGYSAEPVTPQSRLRRRELQRRELGLVSEG